MRKCYFSILVLFFHHITFAQESPLIYQFESYSEKVQYEKVYVHTSREVVSPGDTLWFSVYVVDGSFHLPSPLSSVVYVEWYDDQNKLLERLSLEVDGEGKANGEFILDFKAKQGLYTIRAYTHYQRNVGPEEFFRKPIFVLPLYEGSAQLLPSESDEGNYQIDFFPEGGDIVGGVINYIACKSVDAAGNFLDISGHIIDDLGQKVSTYESIHDGMGVIQLKPEKERKYYLEFAMEGVPLSYPLPSIDTAGYAIHVRQNADRFYITVQGNQVSFEGSYLVAQCRGTLVKLVQVTKDAEYFYTTLSKSELPTGITQLTFFDGNHRPQLERLIYNENPLEQLDLEIKTDASSYKKRSPVQINLKLTNAQDLGIDGNLSMVVLPSYLYQNPMQSIRSYFLFQSDLKGHIHQPNYYVSEKNQDRLAHIDLLMMTHGWRRFSWKDIFLNTDHKSYQAETGFSINGQVIGLYNPNKRKESRVYLSFMEHPEIRIERETDDEGNFSFENLEIYDSLTAFVKTIESGKKKQDDQVESNTTIIIKENEFPAVDNQPLKHSWDEAYLLTALRKGSELFDIRRSFGDIDIILDEIAIEDRYDVMEEINKEEKMLYRSPNYRLLVDSIPNWKMFIDIFDLMEKRVPGVQIRGSGLERYAVVRGVNSFSGDISAMFLYDGMPVDAAFISSIPLANIYLIDVLSASSAAVYGSRASKGVIAIYSRKEGQYNPSQVPPVGMAAFKVFGYDTPREFYSPSYHEAQSEKIIPDYRSTLYWGPTVPIRDGAGQATYYTSDEGGDFVIYVEGMSGNGIPFTGIQKYSVGYGDSFGKGGQ